MKSDSTKDTMSFDEWRSRCDNVMMYEYGIDTSAHPNTDWKGLYEEGQTPREAVDLVTKDIEPLDNEDEEDEDNILNFDKD